MSLYLLHIEPRYRHAGHYLGFCQAERVDRRVNEHLSGGSKASPLILAALMAGHTVTLARRWEGTQYDRKAERAKKSRGHTRMCPLCRDAYLACEAAGTTIAAERFPGTKEPSLWKPGAELICTLFQLGTRYPKSSMLIERENGHFVFTLTCELFHISTGRIVGEGGGGRLDHGVPFPDPDGGPLHGSRPADQGQVHPVRLLQHGSQDRQKAQFCGCGVNR